MSKIKYFIIGTIFLCFLSIGIVAVRLNSVKAEETTSTTFPVNEAGIAAYVKLDSVDITDLTEALNYFHSIEKQDATYVIGTMKIVSLVDYYYGNAYTFSYPHLYIGLDGWAVAYYKKDEEASRIMQWKGYIQGTINTTTLKDAIDAMLANIDLTYSTDIKYYDFEFPEANKLTLIAETTSYSPSSNSFSVIIPGTLYEASYSVYTAGEYWQGSWYYCNDSADLSVDGVGVFSSPPSCWMSYYGYYDVSTQLTANVPHNIRFTTIYGGAANVLIYKSQ